MKIVSNLRFAIEILGKHMIRSIAKMDRIRSTIYPVIRLVSEPRTEFALRNGSLRCPPRNFVSRNTTVELGSMAGRQARVDLGVEPQHVVLGESEATDGRF